MTSGNQRYYRIMNTSVSLKSEIPEYVVGERILDVGSGGGVMLDALEKKFGDSKTIIGTEISPIAMEYLSQKKTETKSHWTLASSVTKTSPCWNGLIVPGSTFM